MPAKALEGVDALATAPVGRLLWRGTAQATMSVGVYGIYALTNAAFVAHGVGPTAMGAVNLVAPVLLVLGALATTVGAGGASLVSRALGAGDTTAAARAAGSAFLVFWTGAAAIAAAGLACLEPLLTVLGAEGELRGYAREYAVVILASTVVGTGFSSLVRAEGRLRYATMLWVAPVLVQITLDPILISGFDLGVRGAALGTVGGQAVSAAMSLWFFFARRDRPYRIRAVHLRPHGPSLRALLALGSPSMLAGLGATALALLVNNLLAGLGAAAAVTAYAAAARVQTFATMPQQGISMGMQPIVGFNTGRGRPDRVRRARTLALRTTLAYSAAAAALTAALAGPITTALLGGPDPQAATALRLIAIGIAASGVPLLVSAYFQAVGAPLPSYVISIGTLIALKIPAVLALSPLGPAGVWTGLALGDLAAAATALALLKRRKATRGMPDAP
ncbi:MATE family efflux transporter [Glycomyces terrestris]|uniref:MATE family efflux transporter n=1 Tax=Glycomyces terrestris TaxID=2493553 RepID=A0A426V3C2_9ACTN|nr:MATE family efflux transporter [Glycomyces terrestris]RRS01340.1 MATE family efflux transporter [Glycomyces terrestris]